VVSYLAVHLASGPLGLPRPKKSTLCFAAGFGLIFILAQDFWAWGQSLPQWLGLPAWAWRFVGLSALQTALMAWRLKSRQEL
jgi:hypothetical protein